MIVLSCKDINKAFGIDTILDSVTFSINEGERVGLIGPNGAGKSTLFKIMTGSMEHDRGELFIDRSKTLGYLAQHLNLDSTSTIYNELLTVFQDIIDLENKLNKLEEKMNEPYDPSKEELHNKVIRDYTNAVELYNNKGGYTYKAEISRVLKGLGFTEADFDKPINLLSGGQKTRAALSKLLLSKPEILLLDEPTNHLDLEAIQWLEEYLGSYKGTVLIVSHDRFLLDAATSKTFELINGHINMYNGNYTQSLEEKKKNYEVQMKAYSLQQKEIKRQEEIIERYRSFNREKSIKAAESRQKALDKVERVRVPDKDSKIHSITFETPIKSGYDVLHVENLSKSFGERVLFNNISFDMKKGEKTAIIGSNGRGKTTLFRILMDDVDPNSGMKSLGKNVFVGYYDQEQSDLNAENTVLDEIWNEYPDMTVTEVRSALAAFLFMGDDVFKKVGSLSGGEKCRINILKLMLSKANLLLLDEPTNHLDISSREALEDALMSYDGTLLVISHDRYFLNKVVSKIYELEENEVKQYLGNYSYYVEKKTRPSRFEEDLMEGGGKTKTQIQTDKKKKRELEKQQKEEKMKLKNLEASIADTEAEIAKLQEDLCLEEVYSNPQKSEEINKTILSLQGSLDEMYEEWEAML